MRDIFDGVTKAAHATIFELSFDTGHPMLVNNPEADGAARADASRAAWSGPDMIHEAPPITGAEDFSYFANVVPGFYFQIGVVPEGEGRQAATTRRPSRGRRGGLPIAMRLMSTLVVDYLEAGAP